LLRCLFSCSSVLLLFCDVLSRRSVTGIGPGADVCLPYVLVVIAGRLATPELLHRFDAWQRKLSLIVS
jgi:hypothetical protein